jgi:uridylate kinase
MTSVISLGGSFLFDRPLETSNVFKEIKKIDEKFIVITGGGPIARDYIEFAKKFKLKEKDLHSVGIKCTHTNAFVIAKAFNAEYTTADPRKIKANKKITLTGGYLAGWTTDTCAAYAAVSTHSKVIFNLSKEKGVYDKDPRKFKDVNLLKKITFKKLYTLTRGKRIPGMNFIFDPLAAEICMKNGIEVVVTSDVNDIRRYLAHKEINGTVITNSK